MAASPPESKIGVRTPNKAKVDPEVEQKRRVEWLNAARQHEVRSFHSYKTQASIEPYPRSTAKRPSADPNLNQPPLREGFRKAAEGESSRWYRSPAPKLGPGAYSLPSSFLGK